MMTFFSGIASINKSNTKSLTHGEDSLAQWLWYLTAYLAIRVQIRYGASSSETDFSALLYYERRSLELLPLILSQASFVVSHRCRQTRRVVQNWAIGHMPLVHIQISLRNWAVMI